MTLNFLYASVPGRLEPLVPAWFLSVRWLDSRVCERNLHHPACGHVSSPPSCLFGMLFLVISLSWSPQLYLFQAALPGSSRLQVPAMPFYWQAGTWPLCRSLFAHHNLFGPRSGCFVASVSSPKLAVRKWWPGFTEASNRSF